MPAFVWKSSKSTPLPRFPLTRRITSIGRSPHNDIVLEQLGVDESHVLVQFDGNAFVLQSLTNAADTRVNGKKVRRETLNHGDVVEIGAATLLFELFDQPAPNETISHDEERISYERIVEFSHELLKEHDVQRLLEKLMDAIIELTGAEKGFLLLAEGEELTVRVARAIDQQALVDATDLYSDSIVSAVIASRETLIVSDALKDTTFGASHSVVNLRLCSVLCAPLLYGGELLGLIYVGNDNVVNLFRQSHADVLSVFAANAALIVRNAMELHEVRDDNTRLRHHIKEMRFGSVIGASDAMRVVFRQIERIAPTDISVLVDGETGTGKELIAREIHNRSPRAKKPFVSINCGAIPESLLESELFGHVRGAFTGANQARPGRFQAANGGTLFLDEIGEMPLHLQVKILRALQERVVTRVGDNKDEPIDIRVIAATNRDLGQAVHDGLFREDLYYRLNVIGLTLPPLRDRGDDIVLLARYLLDLYTREFNTPQRRFSTESIQAMRRYEWPGNIRQLENHIKKAVVLADTALLSPADLALEGAPTRVIVPIQEAREQWQRAYVRDAVELCAGNRTLAARELGVDPRTIYRYLQDGAPEDSDA